MPLQPDKPIFNRQSFSKKSQPKQDPHDAVLHRFAASRTPLLFRFNSGREVQGTIAEVHRFYLLVATSERKIVCCWKALLETTEPVSATGGSVL